MTGVPSGRYRERRRRGRGTTGTTNASDQRSDILGPVTFADMSRENSIGFIRLVAASLVIVGHSFTWGEFGGDPLLALTHNQVAIGRFPVDVFFILSGFLIAMSFCRAENWIVYAWHRILRIYPAFLVCIGITGLVLAPLFGRGFELHYVLRNAPIVTGYAESAPGMFAGSASQYVNAALWTLPWEIRAYLILGILGVLGALRHPKALAVAFLALWTAFVAEIFKYPGIETSPAVTSGLRLLTFFFAGVIFYVFRQAILVRWEFFVLAIFAIIAATIIGTTTQPYSAGMFYAVAPLPLAYISLYLGMRLNVTRINALNDRSYGIYIYGSLVLNILTVFGLNRVFSTNPSLINWIFYVLAAFGLTYSLATISWYLIEKPAMAMKDRRPWQQLARIRATPVAKIFRGR